VGTMGAKFVTGLFFTEQVSPDLELPRWIVFQSQEASEFPLRLS